MVAGAAPRAARRPDRFALHVAFGLCRISRHPRRFQRARDRGRAGRVPVAQRVLARRLARPRRQGGGPGCGSSANGRHCAPTRRSAACACSATCRSTSRRAAQTSRPSEPLSEGAVAGVPPDLFAPTGQLWGNPLYDWTAIRADGSAGRSAASPHPRPRRPDARRPFLRVRLLLGRPRRRADGGHGRWRRGPGSAVFEAVERELGELAVVAEDLGVITEPVVRLRRELGFPGMAVLQFAFGRDPTNPHRPENLRKSSRSSIRARMTTTPLTAGGSHFPTPTVPWTGLDPADPAWSLMRSRGPHARRSQSRRSRMSSTSETRRG